MAYVMSHAEEKQFEPSEDSGISLKWITDLARELESATDTDGECYLTSPALTIKGRSEGLAFTAAKFAAARAHAAKPGALVDAAREAVNTLRNAGDWLRHLDAPSYGKVCDEAAAALADWRALGGCADEPPTDDDVARACAVLKRRVVAEASNGATAFNYAGLFVAVGIDDKAGILRDIVVEHARPVSVQRKLATEPSDV